MPDALRIRVRDWFGGGWFGHGRTRALLALGVVLSLGSVGTLAYWTDTATVNAGTITSGSLDLEVQSPMSGTTWQHTGLGTTATDTQIAIGNLTPNEQHAFDFAARNAGSVPLGYRITVVQAGTWSYVGDPITVQFFADSRAGAEDSTYPIQETCAGGTALATVTVTAAGVVARPARQLAVAASENLCARIGMAATASNDNQGRTGSLRFVFSAEQVP